MENAMNRLNKKMTQTQHTKRNKLEDEGLEVTSTNTTTNSTMQVENKERALPKPEINGAMNRHNFSILSLFLISILLAILIFI